MWAPLGPRVPRAVRGRQTPARHAAGGHNGRWPDVGWPQWPGHTAATALAGARGVAGCVRQRRGRWFAGLRGGVRRWQGRRAAGRGAVRPRGEDGEDAGRRGEGGPMTRGRGAAVGGRRGRGAAGRTGGEDARPLAAVRGRRSLRGRGPTVAGRR